MGRSCIQDKPGTPPALGRSSLGGKFRLDTALRCCLRSRLGTRLQRCKAKEWLILAGRRNQPDRLGSCELHMIL